MGHIQSSFIPEIQNLANTLDTLDKLGYVCGTDFCIPPENLPSTCPLPPNYSGISFYRHGMAMPFFYIKYLKDNLVVISHKTP
jgi:hypothetical protein